MADPTAQEILMWDLINRARLDPAGEAARDGIDLNEGPARDSNGNIVTLSAASKQPLAWNNALYTVADQHSQDMVNNLPGKTWLTGLYHDPQATHEANMKNAGYTFSWWGENVSESLPLGGQFDVTQGIYQQAKDLFVDSYSGTRGHRLNILDDNFQQIGVGEVTGAYQGETRSLITEDFGRPSTAGQFLTGIAYNDKDGDAFYSVGEGQAGVSVTTSAGTAVTATAGNYSSAIGAGTQDITFSGGFLPSHLSVIATIVAGRNALIDVVGPSAIESSVSLTAGEGVTKIIGLGNFGLTLTGNNLGDTFVSPTGGTNTIAGGTGFDTVDFSGAKASYTITDNNGVVTVSGLGLTDTLNSVEKLQFQDGSVTLGGAGSVSINDVAITEGNNGSQLATFTVTRSGGTAAFDVNYATADGTATTGNHDYAATSGSLHFGANENSKTVSVPINGDTSVEPNETFGVGLSGATNGAAISHGQGTGTIINDDAAPAAGSVSINDVAITEGNNGSQLATFTVTRSGGTAAFDVNYATADGTATTGNHDYAATSGSLHFGANENSKTVSVPINGDTNVEPNETFGVLLSAATNGAAISHGQGTGTIINDDAAPAAGSVSINDVAITEGNNGSQLATFTVTRSGGTAAFDVNYATADGTATTGNHDYAATSGSLHFGANENSKTVSVAINGDTSVEPNETFGVGLSGATNGAAISHGQGTGTIINDDAAPAAGSVSINDVAITEGNNGTQLATFTVTRSGGTAAFDVNYATADGTATTGNHDYAATSGSLHFGANENSKTVSVPINGDTSVEPNETFGVGLSGATNGAAISHGQGTGTIINDDAALAKEPDLVVNGISAAANVQQGDSLDLSFLVKNLGAAGADLHYAGINVDAPVDESHYMAWNTVNSLGANGQATLTNSIDTSGLSVGQHTLYVKDDFWHNAVGETNESNNSTSITFNVTAPPEPDLAVSNISAPLSVEQGDSLDFSFLVKNLGGAEADLHYAGINVDAPVDEGHYVAWNTVDPLDGHSQDTLSNSIDTSHLSVGQHTLYLKEDFWHNAVGESNESNNSASVTFNVTAPPEPDLAVGSISAPASVEQGNSLDFSFLIKNLGGAGAGLHYAGINVDKPVDESHYAAWNTVDPLEGHSQDRLSNSIDTSHLSVGQHTLYVKDDFWHNAVGESNESNNAYSVTFNVTAHADMH